MTLFLWSELSGYQDCLSTSNTKTDEQACQDEYYPKIEEKLGLPEGSMKKYGDILYRAPGPGGSQEGSGGLGSSRRT